MKKAKLYHVTLFEVYEETYEVLAESEEDAIEKARRSGTVEEQLHAYELKDEAMAEEMEA